MTMRSAVVQDGRLLAAGGQQPPGHLLRVAPVHLAAQRPDVEARQRPRRPAGTRPGGRRRAAGRRGARWRGRRDVEDVEHRQRRVGRSGGRSRRAPWYADASTARPPVSSDAMELLTNPETWVALHHADRPRDRPRHRQHHLHLDPRPAPAGRDQRDRARNIGLGLAMGMRIALLLTISWIVGLTAPVFTFDGNEFSWRDLILIGGGVVPALEGDDRDRRIARGRAGAPRRRERPDGRLVSAASSSRSSCSTSCSRSTRSSPRSAWPTRSRS